LGFDLTNEKGSYLRFSPSGWALALTLAEAYGWVPAGTTLPEYGGLAGQPWSGEYATNEGQQISSADAAALGEACARAIASEDYVSRTAAIRKALFDRVDRAAGGSLPMPAPFGEPEIITFRGRLEELIAFCREGGFVIE
jgi:hypothetical protein